MKCILDISLSFYLHHSEARRNRSGTDSGQRSEARRNVAGTSGGQRSEARRNGANNAVGQHCRLESTEERRNGTMRKRATNETTGLGSLGWLRVIVYTTKRKTPCTYTESFQNLTSYFEWDHSTSRGNRCFGNLRKQSGCNKLPG